MHTIKKKGSSASKQTEPQLMTVANKGMDLIRLHQKNLMLATGVILILIVIAAGYSLFQSSSDKKASALLAVAQGVYRGQAGAAPDYAKALELYRNVQKEYPRTMSGSIAQFYTGNCLVTMGKPDEALREFETVTKKYSGDKDLAGLAYQRMGYVYGGLGKQADAIASFEKAEALLGPGIATMELAKMYERTGNKDEAQKKNKVIAEKLGGTAFAPQVRDAAAQGAGSPPAKGSAGN